MQVFFDLFFQLFCEFKTYQKKFISTISARLGTTDLVCPILHERRGLPRSHPSHTSSIGAKQQRGSTAHAPGHTDFPKASYTLVVGKHNIRDPATPGHVGSPPSRPWTPSSLEHSLPHSTWHGAQHVQLVIKDGHSASPRSGIKPPSGSSSKGSQLTQGPPQVHTAFQVHQAFLYPLSEFL